MLDLPKHPLPIFDTLESLAKATDCETPAEEISPVPFYVDPDDYEISREFLLAYRGSADTFNSYRREIDRFLQWVYLVALRNIKQVDRQDIEAYMRFCQAPDSNWIGTRLVPRFYSEDNQLKANPEWRPYVSKVSKMAHQNGKKPSIKHYRPSKSAIQATFRVLSTYFTFLEIEDYVSKNVVKRVRQKSRFIRTTQQKDPIRRLSELQWQYVIETAEIMADQDRSHERTLFIMSALYGMYLRISELAGNNGWIPLMEHFIKDDDGNWWFKTIGKGNKERDVSVSDDMLMSLKRYRASLNLTPLPSYGDKHPLILKYKYGENPLTGTRQIRNIVQACFDRAIYRLYEDKLDSDAERLQTATVHWLRHTGISDDIMERPREHVRDDAGHNSSATTDRYINVEKQARSESARNKKIHRN